MSIEGMRELNGAELLQVTGGTVYAVRMPSCIIGGVNYGPGTYYYNTQTGNTGFVADNPTD